MEPQDSAIDPERQDGPVRQNGPVQRIGVVGAGAWGTALALACRRAGRDVILWSHDGETASAINREHENPLFLPGVELDGAIYATSDLDDLVGSDAVLLVPPAQFVRPVATALARVLSAAPVPAILCAKGIEQGTLALMTEVAAQCLPGAPLAVLSGPTFALEVARDQPTAATLAVTDRALGTRLVSALGSRTFRLYWSDDPIGAEVGGAVKNVLAIACGVVTGREFGDNARAALITRGLAEMARLGVARGARAETFMGLSGLGDLTLTCSSLQSRNMSLGYALGRGRDLQEVLSERRAVVEGVYTAAAVVALAERARVDMPICQAVDAILNRGASLPETIDGLLARPFRGE